VSAEGEEMEISDTVERMECDDLNRNSRIFVTPGRGFEDKKLYEGTTEDFPECSEVTAIISADLSLSGKRCCSQVMEGMNREIASSGVKSNQQ
jgi:hypothetical protein